MQNFRQKIKYKKVSIKNSEKSLSKAELVLISKLLEEASDELSYNEDNEYKIPATEDNKQIIINMLESDEDVRQDDLEEVLYSKDEIETSDTLLAGYLANRCRKLSEKK